MLLSCNWSEHQQILQNKQFLKAVIKEAVPVLHAQQVASMEAFKTALVWGYEPLTAAMVYADQPQDPKEMLGECLSTFISYESPIIYLSSNRYADNLNSQKVNKK